MFDEICRIFECGVTRLASFFSGALCALSGGRLPEALFMVFLLDSKGAKVQKCANLVDLVKSFQTSIYLQKSASIRYSRERASQSLPKISQQLEKKSSNKHRLRHHGRRKGGSHRKRYEPRRQSGPHRVRHNRRRSS